MCFEKALVYVDAGAGTIVAGGGDLVHEVGHAPDAFHDIGQGAFTLAVTGRDEIATHVRSLGIDMGGRTAGAQAATLMIRDPDGNHIAFAETFDKGMAR